MKTAIDLKVGVEAFTLVDLYRKAAEFKGLKLHESSANDYSEPIKTYMLDDELLAILEKQGIKIEPRPDCHFNVFTLVDTNPQEPAPRFAPSNWWNFKTLEDESGKFDLRVSLSFIFWVNNEKRGIVFTPQAHGSLVSPADRLPNLRMFKALVESDKDAPAVAKEIAASDCSIVVTWTDLGLGGIRRLSDLFDELAGQNETLKKLGREDDVFDPSPYSPKFQKQGDELFIAEPAQPKIFQAWRKQLKDYQSRLAA
jgi:hypothetical protein